MSAEMDPLRHSDRIFSCVGDILAAEDDGWVPSRALIVIEALDTDGQARIFYSATQGMGLSDIVGMGHYVREVAMVDMLDTAPDDEV